MTMLEILAQCHSEGVRLTMRDGQLRRSPNASAELAAMLQAHREELRAIVGSRSWPWLPDPAWAGNSHCACCVQVEYEGKIDYLPVHAFTRLGEPLCIGCVAKRIGGKELEEL